MTIFILSILNSIIGFSIPIEEIKHIMKTNFTINNIPFSERNMQEEIIIGNGTNPHSCDIPCKVWSDEYNKCVSKECYKWDENLGQCKTVGPDKTLGLVLAALPITSVLGVHWAVAEQWGLFALSISVTLGPCILSCFVLGLSVCLCKKSDSEEFSECWGNGYKCFAIFQVIAIFIIWIMGIVNIAGNNIDGIYHDMYWGDIYCPYTY